MRTSSSELCHGLLPEYELMMEYVMGLGFKTRPEYQLLRNMFKEAMFNLSLEDDGLFDWAETIPVDSSEE